MVIFRTVLTTIICLFLLCNVSLAQKRLEATSSILEFSLQSLKQSVSNVKQRNSVLSAANNELREKIYRAQIDLEALRMNNDNYSYDLEDKGGSLTASEKENYIASSIDARLNRNIAMTEIDQDDFRDKARKGIVRAETLKEDVDRITKEISDLQAKINSIKNGQAEENIAKEKQKAASDLKESKIALNKAEATLKKMHSKFRRPLRKLDNLRSKNNKLKQQFSIVSDNMRATVETQKRLQQEIEHLSSKKDSNISKMEASLAELKARKSELESIIFKVKEKIDGNNIKLMKDDSVEKQLSSNLNIIKEESSNLKEELNGLQSKLKTLETSQD